MSPTIIKLLGPNQKWDSRRSWAFVGGLIAASTNRSLHESALPSWAKYSLAFFVLATMWLMSAVRTKAAWEIIEEARREAVDNDVRELRR